MCLGLLCSIPAVTLREGEINPGHATIYSQGKRSLQFSLHLTFSYKQQQKKNQLIHVGSVCSDLKTLIMIELGLEAEVDPEKSENPEKCTKTLLVAAVSVQNTTGLNYRCYSSFKFGGFTWGHTIGHT